MRKFISLLMTATMVLAAVSCEKEGKKGNKGGNDNPENPEAEVFVLSDLHIGEASFPVKTLTLKHAAVIAGYVETDYFIYTENISGMPLLSDNYPICVPLGDQSLQDVYDLVDDKQGCSLFVITDRELKAEDYDFFDAIPVAILPESALDTIQAAMKTSGNYQYFEGEVVYRQDKVSAPKDIKGKQWLMTAVYYCYSGIYDVGVTEENKFSFYNNSAEDWNTGFVWDGTNNCFHYSGPVIPEEVTHTEGWRYSYTEDPSGKGIILDLDSTSFIPLYSIGDYVIVKRNYYQGEELTYMPLLFEPLPKPVKFNLTYSYGVMVSAGGKDYPVWCEHSEFNAAFLAMGSNVPFFFLDAAGKPEDFAGKNVSGKVVALRRGEITFNEKQANARSAGAIGVIVINNEDTSYFPIADQSSIPLGGVRLSVDKALKRVSTVSFVQPHEFIEEEDPVQTGPQAVDLGIVLHRQDGTAYKILWADCNLGATAPEDGGDYYAWGETDYYYQDGHRSDNPLQYYWKEGKSGYNPASYKYSGSSDMTVGKYCRTDQQDRWGGTGSPDGKTVLEADDDAAQAVLGEGWRIPTAKEFEALAWWCNHEWTAQNGVYGIKVTSTVNGQSIFFPAAGYRSATSIWNTNEGEGFKGFYWTSSLNPKDALYGSIASINNDAQERTFLPPITSDFNRYERYWGLSVRAVTTEETQPVSSPHMGHEFVDMGNGIKMATTNVGAEFPDHPGDYFAWGEVRPKQSYTWSSYRYYDGFTVTRYLAQYSTNGGFEVINLYPEDDAAHINWGGSWRTPTADEWRTLLDKNQYRWEWENGGFRVTCLANNNSIFLPAAGVYMDSNRGNVGSATTYWAAGTFGSDSKSITTLSGTHIQGFDPTVNISAAERRLGFPIRPVCN